MVKVKPLHLNSHFLRFGIGKTTSSQSAPKASKVQQNSPTKKSADSKRKKLIQRNYSTKSLMGGLSFGRYWPNRLCLFFPSKTTFETSYLLYFSKVIVTWQGHENFYWKLLQANGRKQWQRWFPGMFPRHLRRGSMLWEARKCPWDEKMRNCQCFLGSFKQ